MVNLMQFVRSESEDPTVMPIIIIVSLVAILYVYYMYIIHIYIIIYTIIYIYTFNYDTHIWHHKVPSHSPRVHAFSIEGFGSTLGSIFERKRNS